MNHDSLTASGRTFLAALSDAYDPLTQRVLSEVHPLRGAHVLEIGPGAATMASWLTGQVGPGGTVVALDRAPVTPRPASSGAAPLDVIAYQIDGPRLPVDITARSWDLIYSRLTLGALSHPTEIAALLASKLKPGGSLVVQEHVGRPTLLHPPPEHPDARLFAAADAARRELDARAGIDPHWPTQLASALIHRGLAITGGTAASTWTGGEPQATLLLESLRGLPPDLAPDPAAVERLTTMLEIPDLLVVLDTPMLTTIATRPTLPSDLR